MPKKIKAFLWPAVLLVLGGVLIATTMYSRKLSLSQAVAAPREAAEKKEIPSSYLPVVIKEPFADTMARMKSEKAGIMGRQQDLLKMRYDLSNRPAKGVTMTRGKAVQEGVRAKLHRRHDLGKTGGHESGGY